MGRPDQKKAEGFFCLLFFLEPGEASGAGAGLTVKEAREYMLTGRLLDREG